MSSHDDEGHCRAETADAVEVGVVPEQTELSKVPPELYIRLIIGSSGLLMILIAFLGPIARILKGTYTVTTSSMDVIALCGLHSAAAVGCVKLLSTARLLRVVYFAQFEALLLLLLVSTKWWLLRPMASSGAAGDVCVVIFAGVFAVVHVVSVVMIHSKAMEGETALQLRWESTKVILRPYFMPEGHRNKVFVVLTWCVLAASKACSVAAPLVLGKIMFNLTNMSGEEGHIDASFGLIVLYCALNFIPSTLTEVQDSLYVKVFQTAYAQVAEFTFRHVHSLSVEWHLKKRMGNVIRSLDRGMEGADSLMYNALLTFLPAIVSAVVALIVVAEHLDRPEIAAVCYLGFGLYCWMTLVGTLVRQTFRVEMNEHDNDMHDKASDSLINFETVKCFTNEEYETQSYIASVKQFQKKNFKDQAMMSAMNVSQAATSQGAMMISMMIAAYAVSRHRGFQASDFVTVQAYVMSVFSPLDYLGYVYSGMMNGITDIQNLSDLLAAQPDVVDEPHAAVLTPPTTTGSGMGIEFRNVSFHYPTAGPNSGLKDVSFVVPPGTSTALVGPTGSGKTTISRLLFRFYDPIEGSVRIDGSDVRRCTQKSVRSLIGVVPQEAIMFNDTIMNNIRYGRLDASDEDVMNAARAAHIYDSIVKFELGFLTMCGERGLKLSGGEKQRIAIARCLLKNPPIVLLDEATSALDNKTERLVQEALACLEGRTTLIIAHRLSTVQFAHQIIVLRDGMIAERGTHHELLALKGLYSEMWDAQGSTAASPTSAIPPSGSLGDLVA